MSKIQIEHIRRAAKTLQGWAVKTPMMRYPVLEASTGAQLWLKAENTQRTGSFKFRGAFNALSNLSSEERDKGVVAVSSGNHAQGIAEAGRILGIRTTIVMPHDAPKAKVQRTLASGALIVTYDRETGNRDAVAADVLASQGGVLIHPFENPNVIAGQGTVGLEMVGDLLQHQVDPDIVLVCTGGGGLLAGISTAIWDRYPQARIFSVEPAGFDDYRRSIELGHRVANERTSGSICDAILTEMPGQLSFETCGKRLAGGISVTDEEAIAAMVAAFQDLRVVVEPGGAVALAAILSGKLEDKVGSLEGKSIVATLSGGNVDPDVLMKHVSKS